MTTHALEIFSSKPCARPLASGRVGAGVKRIGSMKITRTLSCSHALGLGSEEEGEEEEEEGEEEALPKHSAGRIMM